MPYNDAHIHLHVHYVGNLSEPSGRKFKTSIENFYLIVFDSYNLIILTTISLEDCTNQVTAGYYLIIQLLYTPLMLAFVKVTHFIADIIFTFTISCEPPPPLS